MASFIDAAPPGLALMNFFNYYKGDAAGLDFNTKNEATDYQSGNVFHFDLTVAQHLPLSKYGIIGLGFNAFYWQQFTDDSGSGATLGGFQGRTRGIGLVLSYISPPIGGHVKMASRARR